MTIYYGLNTKRDRFDIRRADLPAYYGKTLCLECHEVLSGKLPAHIFTEDICPPGTFLSFSYNDINIAHERLLSALGWEEVRRDAQLGTVEFGLGKQKPGWHTFLCRHRVLVRGSKEAGYRCCKTCKRVTYFAMGKIYLCGDIPEGVDIFQSGLWQLVITEKLFNRLTKADLKGIWTQKIPLLQEPLDGFSKELGPYHQDGTPWEEKQPKPPQPKPGVVFNKNVRY